MTNIYFQDEEITINDLYFVCYMIERVARKLHQRNYQLCEADTDRRGTAQTGRKTREKDYKNLWKYVEDNESLFRRVSTETVDAIAELTHSKELAKVMEQKNSQKGEVDMCVALRDMMEESKEQGIEQGIERGIEQGIERGIEQGIEQGIERGINLVAENMIKANKPASEIEMFTGLSIDHLKKMARKMGVALVI